MEEPNRENAKLQVAVQYPIYKNVKKSEDSDKEKYILTKRKLDDSNDEQAETGFINGQK